MYYVVIEIVAIIETLYTVANIKQNMTVDFFYCTDVIFSVVYETSLRDTLFILPLLLYSTEIGMSYIL